MGAWGYACLMDVRLSIEMLHNQSTAVSDLLCTTRMHYQTQTNKHKHSLSLSLPLSFSTSLFQMPNGQYEHVTTSISF